jgi:hypothetical protein
LWINCVDFGFQSIVDFMWKLMANLVILNKFFYNAMKSLHGRRSEPTVSREKRMDASNYYWRCSPNNQWKVE